MGSLVGYLTISYLSDNKGRKSAYMLSLILAVLGSIFIATALNIYMILFGYFFLGLGINTVSNLHFTFISEHSSNDICCYFSWKI